MFWKNKPKLPITAEDKAWIEGALLAVKNDFGTECFDSLSTILPDNSFYNYNFTGQKSDAEYVLSQTKIYLGLEDLEVKLDYFNDHPVKMTDGTLLSSPADINGRWQSATGLYEQFDNEIVIHIESSILENPIQLIATMAHELSHYILLGEGRIEDNDEYLTDLVTIAYGFGIFMGNSRFTHTINESDWQISSSGYLPEQIIAYAMAWLAIYRKENTTWKTYLNKSMLKYFEQSIEYINAYPENIDFGQP